MSTWEEKNWKRFQQITGPVGQKRFDDDFAYLRQVILSCHHEKPPTIARCRLKYDYRDCFPKDIETEIEMMLENIDADINRFVAKGKSRT